MKTMSSTYTDSNKEIPPHSPQKRNVMGRRALMAGGGLAAIGVIAAEAPLAVNFGRSQLAKELTNLEGIGLDAAGAAADATLQAVDTLVMPVAQVFSEISLDTLKDLVFAVGKMDDLAGTLGINRTALSVLRTILISWEADASAIPGTIHQLNAVERDDAKRYIASLKQKQVVEANKI
jgi:hypothetical protein